MVAGGLFAHCGANHDTQMSAEMLLDLTCRCYRLSQEKEQGSFTKARSKAMTANTYTIAISDGLRIDRDEAEKIQDFISTWFDDFRWSSATLRQIIVTAKQARKMMNDPKYAELLTYEVSA